MDYDGLMPISTMLEDYQSIALHFENEKNHFLSGKFFLLSVLMVLSSTMFHGAGYLFDRTSTESLMEYSYNITIHSSKQFLLRF
jgi:hypothetical protein